MEAQHIINLINSELRLAKRAAQAEHHELTDAQNEKDIERVKKAQKEFADIVVEIKTLERLMNKIEKMQYEEGN